MVQWIFVSLCVLLAVTVSDGQSCSQSSQCGSGQCCRDVQSNATLVFDPSSHLLLDGQGGRTGQCFPGKAGPREGCDTFCTCPPGYECYARLTGVCCGVPSTCIPFCEAQRLKLMDRCFPPPMAPNPGSGGLLQESGARRRRSISPLDMILPLSWQCRLLLNSSVWDMLCRL